MEVKEILLPWLCVGTMCGLSLWLLDFLKGFGCEELDRRADLCSVSKTENILLCVT